MKKPTFNGVQPVYEGWLDDDTFIVRFHEYKSSFESWGETVKTTNELFAEVHLDEDNEVIIGVNVYEVSGDYLFTDYYTQVGTIITEDGLETSTPSDMDSETWLSIKEYALEQMKLNQ